MRSTNLIIFFIPLVLASEKSDIDSLNPSIPVIDSGFNVTNFSSPAVETETLTLSSTTKPVLNITEEESNVSTKHVLNVTEEESNVSVKPILNVTEEETLTTEREPILNVTEEDSNVSIKPVLNVTEETLTTEREPILNVIEEESLTTETEPILNVIEEETSVSTKSVLNVIEESSSTEDGANSITSALVKDDTALTESGLYEASTPRVTLSSVVETENQTKILLDAVTTEPPANIMSFSSFKDYSEEIIRKNTIYNIALGAIILVIGITGTIIVFVCLAVFLKYNRNSSYNKYKKNNNFSQVYRKTTV